MERKRLVPAFAAAVATLLVSMSLTSALVAQPNPGDWVLSDFVNNDALVVVDPTTGVLSTLVPPRQDGSLNAVAMAEDNDAMVALLTRGTSEALLRISRTGRVQTQVVFPAGANPNGIAFDQDGAYLISAADANLYRVRGFSILDTIRTGLMSTVNAVAVDVDSGDAIIGTFFGPGDLMRVNMTTSAISTIASGFAYITGIAQQPSTGNFWVTTTQGPQIRVVSQAGSIVSTMSFFVAAAAKVDEPSGNVVVAGWRNISVFDPAGTVLRSYAFPGMNFSGVEIYASRRVSGAGRATPGSIYFARFTFPEGATHGYAAAMALAARPGQRIDRQRTIHLAPDGLYEASARGLRGIASNFVGTLDSEGKAFGRIDIPSWVPVGTRFYISAVACDARNYLMTGNTIGVTVR